MTRDLHQDQRAYHHLMLHPKRGDTPQRIAIESYYRSKGMLYELRDYEYVPKNSWEDYKPKKRNLKLYNHLYLVATEQSEELDKREEQWEEDNQDYILELNR